MYKSHNFKKAGNDKRKNTLREVRKINGLRTAYRGELKKHVIERKLVLAQMAFMYLACGILMAWISSDTTKFRWHGNAPP